MSDVVSSIGVVFRVGCGCDTIVGGSLDERETNRAVVAGVVHGCGCSVGGRVAVYVLK